MSTEEFQKKPEDTKGAIQSMETDGEIDEILEELEKKPRDEQKEFLFQVIRQEEHHQGPLPHPKILEGYEKTCPGAADRIITMAEKQQDHRMEMEKSVITAGNRDSKLGIICGTLVCIAVVIAGVVMTFASNSAAIGAFLSLSGLGSLVGTFIYGTRSNSKERVKKAQAQEPTNEKKEIDNKETDKEKIETKEKNIKDPSES